ncbi:2'-5' RNA ligase family protein [Paraburkholderia sp. BCC1885]|uniref:2'-5' RNA ligase family protein n=1 Tax=Paraburkholderia sp. BCC1885 TaxID=2562669 RepID=UPI001181D85A|nr:2'-5' RNA ligase family protein [Paraburkholderia sp. BCC1885]
MPEQFWLPGLEAPPVATDGLFFAVLPDANTAASITKLSQQIRGEIRSKGKPLAANRLHVTLSYLGNFAGGLPQGLVDAAIKAAASIKMEPFSVEFDHALRFGPEHRPGPLVLAGGDGVVGLHTLNEALARALQNVEFGDPVAARRPEHYKPHVTLAYGMPYMAARPVEAVSWNVREFVLVHSLVGLTRHIELARWTLTG